MIDEDNVNGCFEHEHEHEGTRLTTAALTQRSHNPKTPFGKSETAE